MATEKIIVCLKEVFSEIDPNTVNESTVLGDLPGWDSMNSVNLLMELESAFSVSLADEILSAKQRVSDITELLRSKGSQV